MPKNKAPNIVIIPPTNPERKTVPKLLITRSTLPLTACSTDWFSKIIIGIAKVNRKETQISKRVLNIESPKRFTKRENSEVATVNNVA